MKNPTDIYSQSRRAVVYINNNCSGFFVFPDLNLSYEYRPEDDSLFVSAFPAGGRQLRKFDVVITTASGFIYDSSGMVLTNAHVVSCDRDETESFLLDSLYYMVGSDEPLFIDYVDGIEGLNFSVRNISHDILKEVKEKHATTSLTEDDVAFELTDAILDYMYQNAYLPEVVESAPTVYALIDGNVSILPAIVLTAGNPYPGVDIAVLKIDSGQMPFLPLKKSGNLMAGEEVYVMGYPAAAEISDESRLEPSITRGIISAFKKSEDGVDYMQVDAAAGAGNSGGPVFNKEGDVIGMLTAVSIDSEGFNFILPYSVIQNYTS